MYCEKCNKYYSKDDKYCNICGNELIEKEVDLPKEFQEYLDEINVQ